MAISFSIGPEIILSYKRLSYTPWNAIAEFIDNSTQSYINNKNLLDVVFKDRNEKLQVFIVYRKDYMSITDNSIGMSQNELEEALKIAVPTSRSVGRSKYGMGMKTAACWIGNRWTVRTKKLGESVEYTVEVDVNKIASGDLKLPFISKEGCPAENHYTVIEIFDHNRKFVGRSINQIKAILGSTYREDLRKGTLELFWNNDLLVWGELDSRLLTDPRGTKYRKEFSFFIDEEDFTGITEKKEIKGWVGVLRQGSRLDAGFTVLQAGRVIQGYPNAWRPEKLYGPQGSNDLANQRLVGEINVDGFDVSHTKDSLLWTGELEEIIEEKLDAICRDYREIALTYRSRANDQRGPTAAQTELAISAMNKELQSAALIDVVTEGIQLPEEVIIEQTQKIADSAQSLPSTFEVMVGDYKVRVYIQDRSAFEPYLVVDSAHPKEVGIVINREHPHWSQLRDTTGVLNYLRHCIYDGIAEWRARHQMSTILPATIKLYKDKLLWIPLQLETLEAEETLKDGISASYEDETVT